MIRKKDLAFYILITEIISRVNSKMIKQTGKGYILGKIQINKLEFGRIMY